MKHDKFYYWDLLDTLFLSDSELELTALTFQLPYAPACQYFELSSESVFAAKALQVRNSWNFHRNPIMAEVQPASEAKTRQLVWTLLYLELSN